MSEAMPEVAHAATNGAAIDAMTESELRSEVARLRDLVGPSEQSYDDLRADVLAARDVAKGAEAAAGVLRGRMAELEVELARARQDQDHFQRVFFGRARSAVGRLGRSVRARLF